ncbi:MAG TPA: hypothetical protein VHV82_11185 [Sporichthyaceae bacterium]|jgi:hypothetical protein|nr:hypothetical protein [Sporichthyaceae bacterium]
MTTPTPEPVEVPSESMEQAGIHTLHYSAEAESAGEEAVVRPSEDAKQITYAGD